MRIHDLWRAGGPNPAARLQRRHPRTDPGTGACVWRRSAVLALVGYATLTVVQGREVIRHIGDHLPHDAIDPLLNVSILAWNATHVPLLGDWWNFPGFHPSSSTLTFSEHLLGLSVFASPIIWVSGNPVLAYNVLFLASFTFSALAAHALVFRLTGHASAAFCAGLVFGFAPYRVAHLAHLQILSSYWMPLALLGLHGYLDTRRVRWLLLFGVGWLLQSTVSNYQLIYFSTFIGLWVLWYLALPGRWRPLSAVMGTALAAASVLIPILLQYFTVHRALGLSRSLDEVTSYSADVLSLLNASPDLSFWGWLRVFPKAEGELFPGVTLPLLVIVAGAMCWQSGTGELPTWQKRLRTSLLIGAAASILAAASVLIWRPWRVQLPLLHISVSHIHKPISVALALLICGLFISPGFRDAIRRSSSLAFYSVGAVATWLLSLGPRPTLLGRPVMYQAPYDWLLRLPGFDGARAPARFWMITLLCLAVVAAILFARTIGRLRSRWQAAAVAVVALGLAVDGWTTMPAIPAATRSATLETYARDSNVLELPLGDIVRDTAAQYRAVIGGWKTFNGYSGYGPAHYATLVRALEAQTEGLFAVLRNYGNLTVAFDPAKDPDGSVGRYVERQPGARLVFTADNLVVFRFPELPRSSPIDDPWPGVAIHALAASCNEDTTQLMLDGDLASRWECGPQTEDQELLVDLGTSRLVGAVTQLMGPYASDYPVELLVETSQDGRSWEPAWTGPGVVRALSAALLDPKRALIRVEFDPRPARFVRLRQTGRDPVYYWSISELAVDPPRTLAGP